ncbi:MAG TPA: hypothetical protein VF131_01385 [Blastocatellia bacterium]|nr:hypothetical protein [Blastocatellia bacterium]
MAGGRVFDTRPPALFATATALARPVHGRISPPELFFISMAAISIAASVVIALKFIRARAATVAPMYD